MLKNELIDSLYDLDILSSEESIVVLEQMIEECDKIQMFFDNGGNKNYQIYMEDGEKKQNKERSGIMKILMFIPDMLKKLFDMIKKQFEKLFKKKKPEEVEKDINNKMSKLVVGKNEKASNEAIKNINKKLYKEGLKLGTPKRVGNKSVIPIIALSAIGVGAAATLSKNKKKRSENNEDDKNNHNPHINDTEEVEEEDDIEIGVIEVSNSGKTVETSWRLPYDLDRVDQIIELFIDYLNDYINYLNDKSDKNFEKIKNEYNTLYDTYRDKKLRVENTIEYSLSDLNKWKDEILSKQKKIDEVVKRVQEAQLKNIKESKTINYVTRYEHDNVRDVDYIAAKVRFMISDVVDTVNMTTGNIIKLENLNITGYMTDGVAAVNYLYLENTENINNLANDILYPLDYYLSIYKAFKNYFNTHYSIEKTSDLLKSASSNFIKFQHKKYTKNEMLNILKEESTPNVIYHIINNIDEAIEIRYGTFSTSVKKQSLCYDFIINNEIPISERRRALENIVDIDSFKENGFNYDELPYELKDEFHKFDEYGKKVFDQIKTFNEAVLELIKDYNEEDKNKIKNKMIETERFRTCEEILNNIDDFININC